MKLTLVPGTPIQTAITIAKSKIFHAQSGPSLKGKITITRKLFFEQTHMGRLGVVISPESRNQLSFTQYFEDKVNGKHNLNCKLKAQESAQIRQRRVCLDSNQHAGG
jgi:hypothetical protein